MTSDGARPAAAEEVIARVNRTLSVSRARIEVRTDRKITRDPARRRRRRPPGPAGRLARSAAEAVWKRIGPGMDLASAGEMLKERFLHMTGEGFVEPAAGRYQIDFGGYAVMRVDGRRYSGPSGRPLSARNRSKDSRDPLKVLAQLREAAYAHETGRETVRGAPCRAMTVLAGTAEFTVWTDEEHVRRIRTEENVSKGVARIRGQHTIELWDFDTGDGPADWTRLPSFRTAEPEPDA